MLQRQSNRENQLQRLFFRDDDNGNVYNQRRCQKFRGVDLVAPEERSLLAGNDHPAEGEGGWLGQLRKGSYPTATAS